MIIEKLAKNGNNIEYLCEIKSKLLETSQELYCLVEEDLINCIIDSAYLFVKMIVEKYAKKHSFIQQKPNIRKALKDLDNPTIKEPKDPAEEEKEALQEYEELIQKLINCWKTLQSGLADISICDEIILDTIQKFYESFIAYIETNPQNPKTPKTNYHIDSKVHR